MLCVESFRDLGVMRCSDGRNTSHCQAVCNKASKLAGAIRHIFQSRAPQLMWPAFLFYVRPIVMYASQAWSPALLCDINLVEKIQKRFSKCISGLHDLSYVERLRALNALSLRNARIQADLIFAYKATHGLINYSASDLGLNIVSSHTRSDGMRLVQQRAVSRTHAGLFSVRVPSQWNKLPTSITACRTLFAFKRSLFKSLSAFQ